MLDTVSRWGDVRGWEAKGFRLSDRGFFVFWGRGGDAELGLGRLLWEVVGYGFYV